MLDAAIPTLEGLQEPIASRLAMVQAELEGMVEADFGVVNEVSDYVLSARGKMLRPTLVLLCNAAGGNPAPEAVRLASLCMLQRSCTTMP